MATITLRATKGSPLTNTEVDSNFTNLNNDKLESSDYTAADVLTKIKTVDGAASGLDADLLDGQQGSYYLDFDNFTDLPDPTITLGGDLSGSVTLTNLASGTLTATIAANAVALGTDTTGNYVATIADAGNSNITVANSGSETAAVTLDLTNSGVTANTYGSATAIPQITIDAKGRITSATTVSVSSDLTVAGDTGSDTVTVGTDTFTVAGGTGVSTSMATNTLTIALPQAVATSSDVQFDSFGVGTAASGTTGEIRATNNITAFYSDERLKENIEIIPEALEKVTKLRGVTYNANDIAESYGYRKDIDHVGVIAQDVKEVLPEAVKPAPFDRILIEGTEISKSGQDYMTVQYEKLVPLLVEAIKELKAEIDSLKN